MKVVLNVFLASLAVDISFIVATASSYMCYSACIKKRILLTGGLD